MKFDEFSMNQVFETKPYRVSKEEIMSFASQYDPQYMHLDEEKAKQGRFKGIIASGLHTLSISFKLWVELGVYGEDVIAGKGLNNLKFLRPVYPEDVLNVKVEVVGKGEVKNGAGELTLLISTFNQVGKKVLEAELTGLVAK